MSETVLLAEAGRPTGSAASRRLRADGKIPAVVYGHGMDPLPVTIDRRDLRLALSGTAGLNTILDVTVDGTVYPSLIKDIQRHPVRRNIHHVDFIQVNLNEKVVVSVPVRLTGEAKDVSQHGGLVDLAMTVLEVATTPRNIPDEIEIDITDMTMDSVIRVVDLPLPSGVTAIADDDAAVVTVLTMRAEAEEAATAAEGEEAGELAESDDTAAAGDGDDASGDDAGE